MLNYARLSGKPIEKRYRCDSLTDKRFMLIRVIPHTDDLLEVQCLFQATSPLKTPLEFEVADYSVPYFITRCSICNRLKPRNGWFEPDDAEVLAFIDTSRSIKVIYGVCPSCQAHVRRLREANDAHTDVSRQAPEANPSSVQSPMA